jgi:hypothetical protein
MVRTGVSPLSSGTSLDPDINAPCTESWHGITCSSNDDHLFVQYVKLSGACLDGTLPSSLGNLSGFAHFDKSFNSLQGKIPEDIGQLGNNTIPGSILKYINFEWNLLTGRIPILMSKLLNLTDLYTFTSSSNRMDGPRGCIKRWSC